LKNLGYDKVVTLKGGWREWERAGYPNTAKDGAE